MSEHVKLLTPKFLTVKIAEEAVKNVVGGVFGTRVNRLLNRMMCHVVVLVPAMEDARTGDYPDWPNYPIQPQMLYERSFGEKENWPYEFDSIAKCKALQLWHDRNDDRTDIQPHLLFSGDTPFWGGVKRHGIVVACSGVQPYFDKMISGMIADMIVGLAYHEWMASDDKEDDELCFLT